MLTTEQLNKLRECLKFYAKHCPQNSLDGPEGMPTAKRARDMLQILNEARDDMVLVPREPTPEMMVAFGSPIEFVFSGFREAYARMISAAQNTEKG